MDRTNPESPEGNGSVKAATIPYGERIHGRKPDKHRTHIPLTEDSTSKTGELLQAKLDVGRQNESKKFAEKEKALAETELYRARSAAKELAQRIEDSSIKTRDRRLELQQLRVPERAKAGHMNDSQYPDMLQKLRVAKEELSRLKLDMASALEAKAIAEKEIEASGSRAKSYESFAEEQRQDIEEANEEHVLAELARLEAERELREIEAHRGAEVTQFSKNMELARKKIKDLRREINRAKELEIKLAATNFDVNVLQNEMELVRAMERNSQKNAPLGDADKRREDDSESISLLRSAEAELNASKKELERVREEGFQFMALMDLVREEGTHVAKETERLKKLEKKADTTAQNLHSKLLAAKSKLEYALVSDERTRAVVSNLSSALQRLQTEIEAAKKEKEAICEETEALKMEIKKMDDLNIMSPEEGLQAITQELDAVKASEAFEVKKLRHVRETTMRSRTSASLHGSTVTISKSEYDYLRSGAVAAQVVADKKVAAAQAWIEALKAGEKEILMKTEVAEREIKDMRAAEEQEVYEKEKSLVARRTLEEELGMCRRQNEEAGPSNLQLAMATRSKSIRASGIPVGARRARMRRLSASPGTRHNPRSPSFTIKRRAKVMPMASLLEFLRNRRTGKHK